MSVSVEEQLRAAIMDTYRRRGTVLIPAFAVGRSQQLTLIITGLMERGELPRMPLHLDSPMAVDATRIYGDHMDEHHLDDEVFADGRDDLFSDGVTLHRSTAESKQLNDLDGPRVIVSPSGMLSGGRVVHHLARLMGDPKNLILLAGYQAGGTRGRKLLDGSPTLRMYGRDLPVRARSQSLHGLSAHGGRSEMRRWMTEGGAQPKQVYLTHGEPESSFAFARYLERELEWPTHVPELDEVVDLD